MTHQPATRDAGHHAPGQAVTREEYMRKTGGGIRPFERQVIQRRRASNGTGLRDAS